MSEPDSSSPPTAAPEAGQNGPGRSRFGRVASFLIEVATYFVLVTLAAWSALAILYGDAGMRPRYVVAGMSFVAFLAVMALVRPRRVKKVVCLGMFGVVLGWYLLLKPSNEREWAAEVARCPVAQLDRDRLTVRNVRNFGYRTAEDFDAKWEERTYDLSRLRTADLLLCYWGSKSIAHAMVSFVFDGASVRPEYLTASIETRKERGEEYSALQGFFRQYELIYIFADERDVVRLRTNVRHEDVYLYHTTIRPNEARRLLLSYLQRANELAERPEFYNALTSNCVTNVVYSAREINPGARITWQTLLSGYAGRQAYGNGRLDTSVPFAQLEARSRINDAALAVPAGGDFSELVRVGLPDPKRGGDVSASE